MDVIACFQIKICHEGEITDLFHKAAEGRIGTRGGRMPQGDRLEIKILNF